MQESLRFPSFFFVFWSSSDFWNFVQLFFRISMDSFKKLKLYPDRWFKKCTKKELEQSKQRLTAYSISKELDQGILEVGSFSFFT